MTTIKDNQTYQVSFYNCETEKEEKKNVFFTGLKDTFYDANYVRSTIWTKLVEEGILKAEWLEASETKKQKVHYKLSWVVTDNVVWFVLHGDTFDIYFRPVKMLSEEEAKRRKLASEILENFCNTITAQTRKKLAEKKAKKIKEVEIPETENKADRAEKNGYMDICECCGKKLKNKVYQFHATTNWTAIPVSLTEEDLKKYDIDSQGWFDVGSTCAKKFPKGYTIKK